MIPQIDFQRHTQIRDRIRSTLDALKTEGISTGELIECVGNELHLLKIQDERDFRANAKDLHRPGAGLSQTTQANES
jgi:uncharacterized protein YoaH (UPF0181 family)